MSDEIAAEVMENRPQKISIIIPAHNEEAVIGRCLSTLQEEGQGINAEVIVVCNGCTDATVKIANSFKNVTVLDIPTASKIAALNAGDAEATCFPRVYLDADITIPFEGLKSCIDNMSSEHLISAPSSRIEMKDSSWFVRAFFKVWMQLPYYKSGHMVGTGIYILTKEGRERFGDWPQIIADDAYVRALFNFEEIFVDSSSTFTIFAPKELSGLIKIRTRARFGNIQLEQIYPQMAVLGENGLSSLVKLLIKRPTIAPSWLVYFMVQLVVIMKCKKKLAAKDFNSWERDESARQQ